VVFDQNFDRIQINLVVFNQDNQDFLFRATKSGGIQMRLQQIYKMSVGIQKYIDFNAFF